MITETEKKPYTLKKAASEIQRLEELLEKKQTKYKALAAEIKDTKKALKNVKDIHKRLEEERLQSLIAAEWFKNPDMTGERIAKYLELSKQLGDKIDNLDAGSITDAVALVCDDQQSGKPKED